MLPSLDSRRAAKLATSTLLAAFVASFVANGSSCRNVVAGNDRDAATDLCTLLQRCYGSVSVDCTTFADRFGVSLSTDDHFLAFMSQNDCLASCDAAKKCWDYPPICQDRGSCARSEQCCGFTSGLETCDQKSCCAPPGVPCDGTRSNTCCGGLQCVPSPAGPATCGGIPACFQVGEVCSLAVDCCSKSCIGGHCAQKTCSLLGEPCGAGGDGPSCCSLEGVNPQAVACVAGVCAVPSCNVDPCNAPLACDPNADPSKSCCSDPTLHCVPDVSGNYGVCLHIQPTAVEHVPDNFDCAYDTDCCPGHSCINAGVNKCALVELGCNPTGAACDESSPMSSCCSGQCVNQRCTCGNTTCHSPFEEGPAIACAPDDPAAAISCTDTLVCVADPFCCCNEWDAICVAEAMAQCH